MKKIITFFVILFAGQLNAQNVGIGTTTPTHKLTVVANNYGIVQTNGTDTVATWVSPLGASQPYGWMGTISNIPYRLGSGNNNSHVTILNNGNVGIGPVAVPKAPFTVAENKTVLFGADTLGGGTKMMWIPSKRAFRGGTLQNSLFGNESTFWNPDSIGYSSFAYGFNVKASGAASTAMGSQSKASGFGSTAMGYSANAIGETSTAFGQLTSAIGASSTAIGTHTIAKSFASTAMGLLNDPIVGSNSTLWVPTDPLVTVGNGIDFSSRSNALTIYKNGNQKIQGYTQLGDDAPKIKTKKLTGTTTTANNSFLFLATGIADPNKILGIQVMVNGGGYFFLPHSSELGYLYTVNTDPYGGGLGQSIAIGVKDAAKSGSVMGKDVKVLITYEE